MINKINLTDETLQSLASKAGGSMPLEGQSDNSMDPIDKNQIQDSTLRFAPSYLTWITDDSSYFNCIRFHSEDFFEDPNEIETRRSI
jgi:hypothetical protein